MPDNKENKSPKTIFRTSAGFECLELYYKNNIDLYLCHCGIEDCHSGHSFGPFKRVEYVIHYIMSGKGTYSIGNKTYHLGPGDFFLIRPGDTTFYRADDEDPWSYIWVGFLGVKVENYVEYLHLSDKNGLTGKYPEGEVLKNIVSQMVDARALTYSNELKREGLLYLFLSELSRYNESSNNEKYPKQIYVDHVLNYIEHHYCEKIRVSDIADGMGLSRGYLSNCFKKTMGESIQDYLIRYRMEKAEELLATTGDTINQIAALVGYEDALTFSKAFHKKNGISPSVYRQNQQANDPQVHIKYDD